jgi:hypothetical protein
VEAAASSVSSSNLHPNAFLPEVRSWRLTFLFLLPVISYFVGNPLPCRWYFVITLRVECFRAFALWPYTGPPVPGQGLPQFGRTTAWAWRSRCAGSQTLH